MVSAISFMVETARRAKISSDESGALRNSVAEVRRITLCLTCPFYRTWY